MARNYSIRLTDDQYKQLTDDGTRTLRDGITELLAAHPIVTSDPASAAADPADVRPDPARPKRSHNLSINISFTSK